MDDIQEIFKKACNRLCYDLQIPFVENNIKKDYERNDIAFNFITHTNKIKVELVFGCSYEGRDAQINITIRPNNNTQPFHQSSSQIQQLDNLNLLIDRWVSWALYRYFTLTYHINLKGMFEYTSIRAYGYPFFTHPAQLELSIFLRGLTGNIKKLGIIRFRHVGDFNKFAPKESFLSRYSYAFSPITSKEIQSSDPSQPVWFFFLMQEDRMDTLGL
jgi:hypothetical protein